MKSRTGFLGKRTKKLLMTKNSFVESLFRVRLTACISVVICALMAVRIPSVMYVAQGVFVVMAFVSIHSRGYKIRRKQTDR